MNAPLPARTCRESDLYRQPDAEINGRDGGCITGTAVYDYRIEPTFDADIGGRDGPDVTFCELLGVEIDGEMIDRAVIVGILGQSAVAEMEDAASREILLMENEKDAA